MRTNSRCFGRIKLVATCSNNDFVYAFICLCILFILFKLDLHVIIEMKCGTLSFYFDKQFALDTN